MTVERNMMSSVIVDSVPDVEVLNNLREFFAAGCFEEPDASPVRRWSRAVRRRFENRALPPYNGELLYPSGPASIGGENQILSPSYSYTWYYNEAAVNHQLASANEEECATLESLRENMRDLEARLNVMCMKHIVGGCGYTHSVPNYGRVVREGLSEHYRRIQQNLALARENQDEEQIDFYLGLQDVLAGIKSWHEHILELLRSSQSDDPAVNAQRDRLISAYERVPFQPARSFFEAMTAYNFTYYLDDCDNPGRIDQELIPYYERDLASGDVTHQEAVKLIRRLWENVDANSGWSSGIGGTTPKGEAGYNELTVACLEAAHKIRRPNLQLHVRRDMPQPVWDAALDAIATGCGLPALYNEEEYLRSLRYVHLGVKEEDLGWHNGGGCTETMIHGRSNVGSLDAGINLPLILVQTLENHLASAESFDELVDAYKADTADMVSEIAQHVAAIRR